MEACGLQHEKKICLQGRCECGLQSLITSIYLYAKAKVKEFHSRLQKDRVLTCVYCGHEYPPGSPSHGADVLTDHIKICDKHPMKAAVQKERERLVNQLESDAFWHALMAKVGKKPHDNKFVAHCFYEAAETFKAVSEHEDSEEPLTRDARP